MKNRCAGVHACIRFLKAIPLFIMKLVAGIGG
jgi:hypothetical protein